MRFLPPLLAFALVGSALWAQQRNTTSPTGFGRILFPGGTPPAGGTPYGRIIYPGTGAPAVARNVQANPTPPTAHPGHSGASIVPYPILLGNYVQYDPPQAPLATSTSPQTDSPVVIVNQYFRPDAPPPVQAPPTPVQETRTETRTTSAPPEKDVPFFLIAMRDHTIYSASAYWVEDSTLNYITLEGSQNSASLDLVDRALSARLNRDRKVAFGLPGTDPLP